MILTRCPQPDCQTTFRVTPEQLKARGGKVRCGQCQHVFNALEHLLDEGSDKASAALDTATSAPLQPATPALVLAATAAPQDASESSTAPVALPEATAPAVPEEADRSEPVLDDAADDGFSISDAESSESAESLAGAETETEAEAEPPAAAGDGTEVPPNLSAELHPEDPILPRETTAIPGYSKWAERPLAGGGAPLVAEPQRHPRWPFVLATLILLPLLLVQVAHHFRSDLAIAMPRLQPAMLALGWDIPLPRKAELVTIEDSDLQADAAKGQLVLQATLKNRAPFVQDLPALELALTDTQDAVVARRVLLPADYLNGTAAPAGFPARGDIPVKLWIETKDLVPSGYRLYVFYP